MIYTKIKIIYIKNPRIHWKNYLCNYLKNQGIKIEKNQKMQKI